MPAAICCMTSDQTPNPENAHTRPMHPDIRADVVEMPVLVLYLRSIVSCTLFIAATAPIMREILYILIIGFRIG